MASNAVPPSVTPPSPDEYPQDLVRTISSITRDSVAKITSTNHGFTFQDVGQTFITIKQVKGMIQINGLDCIVQEVIDANNFTVNINTTNFYDYVSGGVFIIDTSIPPVQKQGFQYFNRPFQNIAT